MSVDSSGLLRIDIKANLSLIKGSEVINEEINREGSFISTCINKNLIFTQPVTASNVIIFAKTVIFLKDVNISSSTGRLTIIAKRVICMGGLITPEAKFNVPRDQLKVYGNHYTGPNYFDDEKEMEIFREAGLRIDYLSSEKEKQDIKQQIVYDPKKLEELLEKRAVIFSKEAIQRVLLEALENIYPQNQSKKVYRERKFQKAIDSFLEEVPVLRFREIERETQASVAECTEMLGNAIQMLRERIVTQLPNEGTSKGA